MKFLRHRKNLAGMGLGAFLGVLTSWYIAPAALPFACLAGAIVGYGHDLVLLAVGQFIRNPRAAFAEPIRTMQRSLSTARPHPLDLANGVLFIAFAVVMGATGFGVFELWNTTPEGLGFFVNYALLVATVATMVTAGRSFVWLVERYAESTDKDIRVQWQLFLSSITSKISKL